MTPLISIILCSYNQDEFIQDAIDSALGQSYARIELVIIDNGSTDRSKELLRSYASNNKVRLLVFQDNDKVTKRLNEGIKISKGDYISILYADDYYLPHKLEQQVACFADLPDDYGVVYSPGYRLNTITGQQWIDPSLKVSGFILNDLLLKHSEGFVNPISPLIRRECLEKYPFDEDLFVEGESINLRFAMRYKFHYLSEPLVVMRDHENNIGKAIKSNIKGLMIVLDRLKQHQDFPLKYCSAVETFRSGILRDSGWQGIRVVGDINWARDCFRRAIKSRWQQLFHPRISAGLALSLLPLNIRKALNLLANRLIRHQGIVKYIDRPDLEV